MQVKLYQAADVGEAMAQARSDLGQDALILGTRAVEGGVEVTAGLEAAAERPEPDRAQLLAFHGVPPILAAELVAGGLTGGAPEGAPTGNTLEEALSRTLFFGAVRLEAGAPPLLVAGPPGAGKTLTVARLATRLVLGGVTPLVVTADGRRAGATEQLAAFTRLLGLPLTVAHQPAMLARAVARRAAGAPVLIDAPATDPFDPAACDALATLAQAAGAAVALVLPAGLDAAEAAELGAAFADAGAGLLVATRLDVARRLGGILAAAQSGALALAEAGLAPGAAAEGLAPLTPALLAHRLLAAAGAGVPSRP